MFRAHAALAFIFFATFSAQAYTLKFQPTLDVYKCPIGSVFILLQCQLLQEEALAGVELQLRPSDQHDPAYVADWMKPL